MLVLVSRHIQDKYASQAANEQAQRYRYNLRKNT
jgi:hypothetical protein